MKRPSPPLGLSGRFRKSLMLDTMNIESREGITVPASKQTGQGASRGAVREAHARQRRPRRAAWRAVLLRGAAPLARRAQPPTWRGGERGVPAQLPTRHINRKGVGVDDLNKAALAGGGAPHLQAHRVRLARCDKRAGRGRQDPCHPPEPCSCHVVALQHPPAGCHALAPWQTSRGEKVDPAQRKATQNNASNQSNREATPRPACSLWAHLG
jgi:hypothetical protein